MKASEMQRRGGVTERILLATKTRVTAGRGRGSPKYIAGLWSNRIRPVNSKEVTHKSWRLNPNLAVIDSLRLRWDFRTTQIECFIPAGFQNLASAGGDARKGAQSTPEEETP